MFALNGILAGMIAPSVVVAATLVMVLTFFSGFKKGARKIGWKTLVCMLAVFLYGPVSSILEKKVTRPAEASIVFCSALMWILYVFVSVLSNQVVRWKRVKNFRTKTEGPILEYEADYSEYDSMISKDYVMMKRGARPGILERVIGGTGSVLNLLLWFATFIIIILYSLEYTKFYAQLEEYYKYSILDFTVYSLIETGMVFVLIKALFLAACLIYEKGFINIIHWFYTKLDLLIVLGAALLLVFVLPEHIIGMKEYVGYVCDLFKETPIVGRYSNIIGKVVASAVMVLPTLILFAISNYILGLFARVVRRFPIFRIIDGVLGSLSVFALLFMLFL